MARPNGPPTREWALHETSVAIYSHEDLCNKVFIAEGGMGAVCRYRNKKLGHDVVVKTCINLSVEEEQNLMKEAKLQLNSATHINIVRLLGFVVLNGGSKGIMLEHLEEGSLHQVIHEKVGNEYFVYTRANIVGWSAEIASALSFLHSTGLKHLDLKPNNILMYSNRISVKIADFGISKFESAVETGCLRGSRCFMAPETFSTGSCCDSDVFSFAIVLWMMIYRDCNPYKTSTGAARELGLEFQREFEQGLRPIIDDSLENAFREVLLAEGAEKLIFTPAGKIPASVNECQVQSIDEYLSYRCWSSVIYRWNSRTLLEKLVLMRDECRDQIVAPRLEPFHRRPKLPLTTGSQDAPVEHDLDQGTSSLFGSMNLHMTSCSLGMSERVERTPLVEVDNVSPPSAETSPQSQQQTQPGFHREMATLIDTLFAEMTKSENTATTSDEESSPQSEEQNLIDPQESEPHFEFPEESEPYIEFPEVSEKDSPQRAPEDTSNDHELALLLEHLNELQAEKDKCAQELIDSEEEIKRREMIVEIRLRELAVVGEHAQEQAYVERLQRSGVRVINSTKSECQIVKLNSFHDPVEDYHSRTMSALQNQREAHDSLNSFRSRVQQTQENMDAITQAIEETEKKISALEEPSTREVKNTTKKTVCVRRLDDDENGFCLTSNPQKLYFTVSHRMLLHAVRINGSLDETDGAQAYVIITKTSTSNWDVGKFKTRQATPERISRKVNMIDPSEVLPNELYLMELQVNDEDLCLRAGHRGRRHVELPNHPGHFVTFVDYTDGDSETNISRGQFPALYFTVL